jgi:hypothetical protein
MAEPDASPEAHLKARATALGFDPGDVIELAGRPATVVGTLRDGTYAFGQPGSRSRSSSCNPCRPARPRGMRSPW